MDEKDLVEIFKSICNDKVSGNEAVKTEDKEANIKNTINSLDAATFELTEYWNDSIRTLADNFSNYISDGYRQEDGNGKKPIHDAGHSFQDSPYVIPNSNSFEKGTYEECRTDEMESVLRNGEFLDFTAPQNNELDITRLLMPRYARRVEVEDLNRNFWVIGQNLSALNVTVSKLNNEVLNNMLKEIVELWQNVYRTWEALSYLYDYINNVINEINLTAKQNNNTKVRVMMTYGFGVNPEQKQLLEEELQTGYIQFTNENMNYFGVLPYIKEAKVYRPNTAETIGYIYYVPYNQLLTDAQLDKYKDEKEIVPYYSEIDRAFLYKSDIEDSEKNRQNLIQIDSDQPIRNTREILEQIRAKNFVLVYFTKTPLTFLPKNNSISNPNYNFLRFYRDFLYKVSDSLMGAPLSQVLIDVTEEQLTSSKTWVQAGGLQFIDLNDSPTDSYIKDNIIDAGIDDNLKQGCRFLLALKKDENYPTTFLEAIANSDNLIGIKNYLNGVTLKEDYDSMFSQIVDEFYKLCMYYAPNKDYPSYFNPIPAQNTQGVIYTLENDNSEIVTVINDNLHMQDTELSSNSKGEILCMTQSDYDEMSAYSIKWDLISGVFDNECFTMSIYDQMHAETLTGPRELGNATYQDSSYGGKYIYPRKISEHLWIDFVENAYYKDAIKSNVSIESFTFNDFCFNEPIQIVDGETVQEFSPQWFGKTTYDCDVSIPMNISANVRYEDFVRAGKPYPDIPTLLLYNITNEDGSTTDAIDLRDSDKPEDRKKYYELFNKLYVTVSDDVKNKINNYNKLYTDIVNENGLFADGFWGQGTQYYDSVITSLKGNHAPIFYLNAMPYGISSSDLIDYKHTEDGQTRKINHTPIIDPNLLIRFINSGHNWQDIEILLTKDKTGFVKPKEEELPPPLTPPIDIVTKPTFIGTAVVKIGDFYPVTDLTSKTLSKTSNEEPLHLINFLINSNAYDINTYGIGSYYMDSTEVKNRKSKTDSYLALKYVDYDTYINPENKDKANTAIKCIDTVTDDVLVTNAYNYLNRIMSGVYDDVKFYEKGGQGDKLVTGFSFKEAIQDKLILTKIGKNCWLGTDGSQWSLGYINHLFYATQDIIIPLCKVGRTDGYFDQNKDNSSTCFSSTGYRHLILNLDSTETPIIAEKTVDNVKIRGVVIPKKLTGYVFWFDRYQVGKWDSQDAEHAKNNKPGANVQNNTINVIDWEDDGVKGRTFEDNDAFQNFVKQSFLQISDISTLTDYNFYERLVGFAPFVITLDQRNEDNKYGEFYSDVEGLNKYVCVLLDDENNYKSITSGFKLLDKYTYIRRRTDTNFKALYNDNGEKQDDSILDSLLPPSDLFNGNDPTNKVDSVSFGGGQDNKSYFLKSQ